MKRFLLFLLIIGAGYFAVKENVTLASQYKRWVEFSFCEEPIGYKVNLVDVNFDLTAEEFEVFADNSAEIWNSAYGKELFINDPDAKLTVNLVYDERQKSLSTINEFSNKVETETAETDVKLSEFEEKQAQLKRDLDKFNELVDYWNSRGGAPKEEYEELKEQQEEISQEIENINNMANSLNQAVDTVNTQISNLNSNIQSFNNLLESKPEEGVYYSGQNKIDIFIYENENGITSTIAHEFGHVLGLPHTESENSIMYKTANGVLTPSSDDIKVLGEVCKTQNRLELIKNDVLNLLNSINP